jgi:osmotically inducible protein OsmC
VSLGSGAFTGPYSFRSRFENGDGTNPEELIGAAHASCFTMALDLMLGEAGHEVESIMTRARVTIEPQDNGFAITGIRLETEANVPGVDESEFERLAQQAKEGCPVSRALAGTPIELEAHLTAMT